MVLIEKKLERESIFLNIAKNQRYSPEYLKIYAKAVLPSLNHDGAPLVESRLISEYLDEAFPKSGSKLIPETPIGHAHMKSWSKAIDEGLHDCAKTTFDIGADFRFVKYAVYAFEANLEKSFSELCGDREWLLGNHYSLEDLGLTPYLAGLGYVGVLDVWIGDRPRVGEWWDRIKAQPAEQKALSRPLSTNEIKKIKKIGMTIKDRIIQLRDAL